VGGLDGRGDRPDLGHDAELGPPPEEGHEALPDDLVVVDDQEAQGAARGGLRVGHSGSLAGSLRDEDDDPAAGPGLALDRHGARIARERPGEIGAGWPARMGRTSLASTEPPAR
jgi:hypothetical protein